MSKQEDAQLILKLYDLRREETMRKARTWLAGFNPENLQDIVDAGTGENNAYLRMVMSYWDMAASLVNNGAIDEKMFNDANGEHFFYYAKFEPFIGELRTRFGPQMWIHLEELIMRTPDAKERLAHLRDMSKKMAAMRSSAAGATAGKGQTDEQPTQTASGASAK